MRARGLVAAAIFARDVAGASDLDDAAEASAFLGIPWDELSALAATDVDLADLSDAAGKLLQDAEQSPPTWGEPIKRIARRARLQAEEGPEQASGELLSLDPVTLFGLILLLRLRVIQFGTFRIEFSNEGVAQLLKRLSGMSDSQAAQIDSRLKDAPDPADEA